MAFAGGLLHLNHPLAAVFFKERRFLKHVTDLIERAESGARKILGWTNPFALPS